MLAFSILHQKQSPMEICRTSGKWHFSIILAHRRYCPIPLVCHGIPRHISFSESDLLNCLADWLSANSATTNRTGQISTLIMRWNYLHLIRLKSVILDTPSSSAITFTCKNYGYFKSKDDGCGGRCAL